VRFIVHKLFMANLQTNRVVEKTSFHLINTFITLNEGKY